MVAIVILGAYDAVSCCRYSGLNFYPEWFWGCRLFECAWMHRGTCYVSRIYRIYIHGRVCQWYNKANTIYWTKEALHVSLRSLHSVPTWFQLNHLSPKCQLVHQHVRRAQWAECWIDNPKIPGSSPTGGNFCSRNFFSSKAFDVSVVSIVKFVIFLLNSIEEKEHLTASPPLPVSFRRQVSGDQSDHTAVEPDNGSCLLLNWIKATDS